MLEWARLRRDNARGRWFPDIIPRGADERGHLPDGGLPAIDPLTGAALIQPRRFTQWGFTPQVPALGQALGAAYALEQPFGNVAVVPTGSPGSYFSRHTTPVPLLNNTMLLGGAQGTNVPGSLASVVEQAGPAFSLFGTFLDNIQVDFLMRATQMDARSSSVDAPRLVVFNGRSAYIEVSTYVSFVSSPGFRPVGGTGVGGAAAQGALPQIDAFPSGRTFSVKPTVSGDRRYVTMEVRPRVTDVTLIEQSVQQGALAAQFQRPNVQMTRIETTVSVPDKGTVLLGGLKLSAENEVEAGVPVLSKIPVLKRAFTNRSVVKDEFVLLILIKPTIIIQAEQEEEAFPSLITSDRTGG